eukprot:superscaffoldBa00007942_g22953
MDSVGGRWTVFQRRMDGSLNFYRPWDQYKKGFGSAAGEYWLGLENVFHLTLWNKVELQVDMEDFNGNKAFARYSLFFIDPESNGYKLHLCGFTDGGAGDSLSYQNGQKFITLDKDQDSCSKKNCARLHVGAFWYNESHIANPNGVYLWGANNTLNQLVSVVLLLLAPVLTSCLPLGLLLDCSDIYHQPSRMYTIYPIGANSAVQLYFILSRTQIKFSTFDKDQDSSTNMNCARLYLVAFWYKDCHYANPSKVYHWGADDTIHGVGVVWSHWKGFNYSLKTISMDLSTFMATDVRATGLKSMRQV